MRPTSGQYMFNFLKETSVKRFSFYFFLLVFFAGSLSAQKIGVYNEKGKKVYHIKKGRNLDFRIDYDRLYPGRKSDSIIEARVYSLIDSIRGEKIFLSESYVVLYYTNKTSFLIEKEYEKDHLNVQLRDIKGMSFSPMISSVGNSLWTVGLAALITSPLIALIPNGWSTDRFVTVATIGAGTAIIGGTLKFAFGQKPVKFKDFDGPDYFKKYQRGSLSIIED